MAITRITKGVIKPNENYDTHNIVSTGIVTSVGLDINGNADISGSLSVGGVLTYEDVTSIDSVGVITARSGIDVDDFLDVGSNIKLGNSGIITATAVDVDDFLDVGGNIKLGNAGVITATSFVGSGANLTGIDATTVKDSGGNIKIQAQASGAIHTGVSTFQDVDVDGHTNLDNVSVSGISTFSGIIDATNTPASIRVAQDIQHKGDADTMLSFGTDIISLKTAGTERLLIQADGDVSFGDATTGRAQIKHISGDQANRNNGGFPQYAFVGNEGTGMRRVSSNVLAFDTTGEERIRISSGGLVGIGTSSPSRLLHLFGSGELVQLTTTTSTNNTEILKLENTHSDGKMTVLGFRTTGLGSPQTKIYGGNDNTGAASQAGDSGAGKFKVTITNPSGTHQEVIYAENDANSASKFLRLSTDGTERLRIDSSGHLKIGTAAAAGGRLYFESTSGAAQYIASGGTNNQDLIIGSSAGEFLRITSGGNLRLGLNSVAEQTDSAHYIMTLTGKSGQTGAGAIAFKDPSANTDGFIFADSGNLFITADYSNATADSSIRFRVDGSSEKMRISSEGYVTKPSHPSFCARFQSGDTFVSTHIFRLTLINNDNFTWNTGSHYSTSTGKFTAPVAGVYYFEAQAMTTGWSNGNDTQDMLELRTNNGLVTYGRQRRSYFRSEDDANGYYVNSTAGQVNLAAGDTVWFQKRSQLSYGFGNVNYTYFTGWLIG